MISSSAKHTSPSGADAPPPPAPAPNTLAAPPLFQDVQAARQRPEQSRDRPSDVSDDDDPLPAFVNIKSTWRTERTALSHGSCQTVPVDFVDAGSQSFRTKEAGVQASDETGASKFKLLVDFNYDSLVRFLDEAEPLLSNALLENIRSTAFDGYFVSWEEPIHDITCTQKLSQVEREPDLVCTEISWSRSGSVVGVAYGALEHSGWCTHKGQFCAWSLNARDLNASAASFAVETTTCLTSLAFHPESPSIAAGGTFNGDLIVWNMNERDNPVLAASKISDMTHQEAISKVIWIPSSKFGSYDLLTIGSEGKLLLWVLDNKLSKPRGGAILSSANIPRNLRTQNIRTYNLDTPLGGTAMTVSKENKTDCIVGTETGFVVRCSLNNVTLTDGVQKDGRLANPIQAGHTSHSSTVTGLSFCPAHRNLFLSCGADGVLRLHHKLKAKSLSTWEPSAKGTGLFSVDWSQHKPTVFAVAAGDGYCTYTTSRDADQRPHQRSALRNKRAATLFLFHLTWLDQTLWQPATPEGNLKVWRLCTSLFECDGKEGKVLEALGSLEEEG
ncbi:WD40-repeat-containing domain protein [Zopfochytrium polystomum]|nr:WD40-repeat-containing domain protein [Zopfochytrium polystomum]